MSAEVQGEGLHAGRVAGAALVAVVPDSQSRHYQII